MSIAIDTIQQIREFNRFYTNILGLLDRHILNSEYSLTEARVLFELSEIGCCAASTLSARLTIDKSYLSRILTGFEKKGLISKTLSNEDTRVNLIGLTEEGNRVIGQLAQRSNQQIGQLLAPLSDQERDQVYKAMRTIKTHFAASVTPLTLRPFTPQDIAYIISRQIDLYKAEYGLDSAVWQAYVADGVNGLVSRFDPHKDCIYILEAGGKPSGCIAITYIEDGVAQLRFFFVESTLRGLGAGNRLIDLAMDFCREKSYKHVFLWTFSKLEAARHLYGKKGFCITETHQNTEWGVAVLEERWDLEL